MKLKKFLSKSFVLSLFFVISCASINEIDKPVCAEITMERGYCVTIISGKGFFIDEENLFEGDTWFNQRHKHIRVPISTWAELKKYLIKNCKKSRKCDANIDSWVRNMDEIEQRVEQ